ncbi:MAG: pyridoxal-phosphate dependent enzyme [Phycisphaerales bacterium]|nr:MAG: pyridoxal-phosphate dependent enzyme [Phycisphaerales bacterium]
MRRHCSNVLEAIGETPLVRIHRIVGKATAAVYAKTEFVNPGSSIEDRIALAMVEAAERDGLLGPGATIIEATSGDTGLGLAMVAAVKNYRCIFVVPDRMGGEKTRLLKAYGAEVVMTPVAAESNLLEACDGVAARLADEIPNAWQADRFSNPNNPEYHYRVTGPEIWKQTEGRITAFVSGIGTGGTISGVGRYLKEQNPKIRVVAADSEGSILSGDTSKPWDIEGSGEDFVPRTFNSQVVDEWIRVSDAESFSIARSMARMEGLLVGGSSATAMAAGLHYAERLAPDDLVVVLCPDTGRDYLSKMYSDAWMIEKGFMKPAVKPQTAGDLLRSRGNVPVISVSPNDKAADAIVLLRRHDISQLPVVEEGKVVGCVRELTLARLLHSRSDPRQIPVGETMAKPMPTVDEHVDLDEVYRLLLSADSAVIVLRAGKIAGIVTRIDLVSFWHEPFEEDNGESNEAT